MNSLTDVYKVSNGVGIPCLGYGTWQTPDGDVASESVKAAIDAGYRHIDCAAAYGNEISVGRGIKESGIPREELFITSKLWNADRGYEKTLKAFEKTCSDLGVTYLDMYLIHWPANKKQFANWEELNAETWRAMTELYKDGRIKIIGVCNFMPHHLDVLMKTEVKPMVDQIEFHPGIMWEDTFAFCREHDILIEAWGPLGTGRLISNETLKEIAAKYGKSVAQLCIRWCLQHNTLPLAKSVTPSRIVENTKVFDFEISAEDMAVIDAMRNVGGSGFHPDEADW